MTVLITLTTAGTDSGPFDLYSDIDGYTSAFETGVSKASLLAGYASALVPDYTTIIRVKSNGNCVNYININLYGTTTTSTTPSPFYRCIRLDGCDGFGYRDVVYNPLFATVGQVFQYYIYTDPSVLHCGTVINNNVTSIADSSILNITPTTCGNTTYCEIPNPNPPLIE